MKKILLAIFIITLSNIAFAEEEIPPSEECYNDCMVKEKDNLTCGIRCTDDSSLGIGKKENINKDPNCIKNCRKEMPDGDLCELMCAPEKGKNNDR